MAAPEPVTVALRTPIKDFGNPVTAVRIEREADGGDLLALEGLGSIKSTLVLIQRLCVNQDGKQMSQAAVESIKVRDIKAIEAALAPFVGDGPEISTPATGN